MELLTWLFFTVGTVFGGLLLHVAAHDFCAKTPEGCERLLRYAASKLAAYDQDRYCEEWLADLAERDSVFSQWSHAVMCWWSAGKMRRAAQRVTIHVVMSQPTLGSFPVEFSSRTMRRWSEFLLTTKNNTVLYCGTFLFLLFLQTKMMLAANRTFEPSTMKKFASSARLLHDFDYTVNVKHRNRSVDVTDVAKIVMKNPALARRALKILKPYEDGIKPVRQPS